MSVIVQGVATDFAAIVKRIADLALDDAVEFRDALPDPEKDEKYNSGLDRIWQMYEMTDSVVGDE